MMPLDSPTPSRSGTDRRGNVDVPWSKGLVFAFVSLVRKRQRSASALRGATRAPTFRLFRRHLFDSQGTPDRRPPWAAMGLPIPRTFRSMPTSVVACGLAVWAGMAQQVGDRGQVDSRFRRRMLPPIRATRLPCCWG